MSLFFFFLTKPLVCPAARGVDPGAEPAAGSRGASWGGHAVLHLPPPAFDVRFVEVMDATRKHVTKAMGGKPEPQITDFFSSRAWRGWGERKARLAVGFSKSCVGLCGGLSTPRCSPWGLLPITEGFCLCSAVLGGGVCGLLILYPCSCAELGPTEGCGGRCAAQGAQPRVTLPCMASRLLPEQGCNSQPGSLG